MYNNHTICTSTQTSLTYNDATDHCNYDACYMHCCVGNCKCATCTLLIKKVQKRNLSEN